MEESQLVWLPKGYQLQTCLRIASISVALYDYLETFPTAWRFYKEKWRKGRLTTSFVLFVLLRLLSIVVLILSNAGFFYSKFDQPLCQRFFLLPPIFKVLQVMVSQAILGFRVYNLAQRPQKVLYIGLVVYITTCSLQWVATLVEREALIDRAVHNCRAFSRRQGRFRAWAFYAIAMAYDVLVTFTSIFYLIKYKSTSSSGSIMRKLANMMLYDGLGYLVALTAINTSNMLLYKTSTDTQVSSISNVYEYRCMTGPLIIILSQSAATSLGYCLTWIMSQRLLIHLHDASRERRKESEDSPHTYSFTSEFFPTQGVSELVQTQLTHTQKHSRSNSLPYQNQARRTPDLEQIGGQVYGSEELDVHVEVERNPPTTPLEDYARRTRKPPGRNIQTGH